MRVLSFKKIWAKYCSFWNELSGWKLFLFYALHYTLLFLILQRFVFSAFYIADRRFIWRTDGLGQWMPKLIYISQTLRDGLQDLFSGDGWTIPLYDFRIGPAKLDFQVGLLNWLAMLSPWDQVDVLSDILSVFRFYLLGFSFSLLVFYFSKNPLSIFFGYITYTFSADFLYSGVTHSAFLMPAILLPLLIVGMEQILQGKRGWLFSSVVFLSLIGSVYLSYMLVILIVVYFLVRYFCAYNQGVRFFFQVAGRTVLWGGIGAILSGVVLIPTLLQMLSTERIGRNTEYLSYNLWGYSKAYYENFISSFAMNPYPIASWTYLGFSPLTVPAIGLLFSCKKQVPKWKSLKILFIVLTIMMCVPAAAYVFSGFNDISNRWCYAYALFVSTTLMFVLPKLAKPDRRYLISFGIVSLIYILICYFLIQKKLYHEEPIIFLLIALLLLVCCYFCGNAGRKAILLVCLLLTCISVTYSAFWYYDPSMNNYVNDFAKKDETYVTYQAGQYASLGESSVVKADNDFFRVSASSLGGSDTAISFYWDLNGLTYYTSIPIQSYKEFVADLEIVQRRLNIWQYGIDGRAPILSLFNVKYDAIRGNAPIPYGFKEVDRLNEDMIFENSYFLPVGYTYDAYMDKADFEQLSSIEKQEAMLQAVILENGSNIAELCTNPDLLSRKMPVTVTVTDGVNWENGMLTVTKENATMTLSFDGIVGTDTYLRVVNLDLTSGRSGRRWSLTATTDETSTYARFVADANLYSHGMKNQVLYLGNSPDGYTICTLTFPQKGTFILDDLEIWCQPMEHYAEQIETLRAEPLKNVEINWRGLAGTVNLSKAKIMCFGIPYETGWSVYVDGEKRELIQANIGLMAVELDAGFHEIELKYWMPGLTIGIVSSCIGLAGVIGLVAYIRKERRKDRAEE